MSEYEARYCDGGILFAGLVPSTAQYPEPRLSPEQIRAFERCAEILQREGTRDE